MIHQLSVNMWFGIAIELAVLTTLMGGLTLYQRWQPLSPEASRKLFHIGGGLTALAFPWIFNSAWSVILLALITTPSLLALKYVRTFKGNLGSVLYRVNRTSFGEIYFPLSEYLSVVHICTGTCAIVSYSCSGFNSSRSRCCYHRLSLWENALYDH
jgi:hypothetical protein